MLTVILPGFSLKNKDWLLETSKKIVLNHEIRPIFWEHWTDLDYNFDPKDKANEIVEVMMGESCNIIAKSIGTLVAS